MTTDNTKIYEAFEEEAKGIDVQDLMAQMMESFNAEKGYNPTFMDEMKIRKLMLAKKYVEREQNRLTNLKAAITAEWDEKIAAKGNEIKGISDLIEKYLKDVNKGKKLTLDVGTATLRRSAPKVKLDTERLDDAVSFLKQHNLLESFQKPAELNVTLLQNSYISDFTKQVEDETKKRIEAESKATEKGKLTKKREGDIKLEVERELAPNYFSKLPDFMKYIPEEQKLSITMK